MGVGSVGLLGFEMLKIDLRDRRMILIQAFEDVLRELSEEAGSVEVGVLGLLVVPPTLSPMWIYAWADTPDWDPSLDAFGLPPSVPSMSISDGLDVGDPLDLGELPAYLDAIEVTLADGTTVVVQEPVETDELAGLLFDLVAGAAVQACGRSKLAGLKSVLVEVPDSDLAQVFPVDDVMSDSDPRCE